MIDFAAGTGTTSHPVWSVLAWLEYVLDWRCGRVAVGQLDAAVVARRGEAAAL